MTRQVTVDGRELDSVDRFGSWRVSDWTGWNDSPDRVVKSEQRPNADGESESVDYFAAREITINGRLIAHNHDAMHEAETWLKGMLLRGSGRMTVRGHGPTQSATVKLNGGIRCNPEPGTDNFLRWQLRLRAIDPYKYGTARSVSTPQGAPLDVFQMGNAPAWPVLTVTGSMPGGYDAVLGSRLVEVRAPLESGKPHVINMRTGRITIGGARAYGVFGSSDLHVIEPGSTQGFYPTAKTSGTATFKLAYSDTYI